MGKVMVRELLLVLVTGLFGWLAIPYILQQPVAFPLLLIGLFLGLTFMPMHAIALMVGRRVSDTVRGWIGVFAWCFAFLANLRSLLLVTSIGGAVASRTMFTELAPPLAGLVLTTLAAVLAPAGGRVRAAGWALFLFSLPMWAVRDILVRMVSPNLVLMLMALLGGTLYMFLHGVLRIVQPTPAEDETRIGPLAQRRAVPDAIVGLVEGTLHRPARPYATLERGLDEKAISVLCKPDEVDTVLQKLNAALGDRPFRAERGRPVKDLIEVVVRPHN